jgi:hypothetical protein
MGNTLLLTAPVSPPANPPRLKRVDPLQRLNDYLWALRFYVGLPTSAVDRILFIENSEYDLTPLRRMVDEAGATERVEFLSFNGLDHPPRYGRGYGEFKLLDYAMDHARFLTTASPDERLWKVTGRYCVRNLVKMINKAPAGFDLYCDVRDKPIPWVDLRVIAATPGGYRKYLTNLYKDLCEDFWHKAPERIIRPWVADWVAKSEPGRVVTRFTVEPYVAGIRGLDGRSYVTGSNLVKYWLRAAERFVGRQP